MWPFAVRGLETHVLGHLEKLGVIEILRIILPLIKFEQRSINAAVLEN